MKRAACTGIAALFAFGLLAPAVAWAQGPRKEVVIIDAASTDYKQISPGVKKKVLWGNHERGPYAAFTRLDPGLTNGMHYHSNEIRIVVIQGAYIYKPQKGKEQRVGPGAFLWLPRGDVHVSSADPKEGALFYEESSGGFDMKPYEAPKGRR